MGRLFRINFILFILLFSSLFFIPKAAFAQSAGPQQILPPNHALVGFGYGSDDHNCTLLWKDGKLNPDGTITEVSVWQTQPCRFNGENRYGDKSEKRSEYQDNKYINGWTWSADTSGGTKHSHGFPTGDEYHDSDPDYECYYQIYQEFDPITKEFIGSPKGWGSSYDGTCNERDYEINELQQVTTARSGKVMVALGLRLGGDADLDYISVNHVPLKTSATITGRVYRTDTEAGFGGVKITTCREGYDDPPYVITGSDGRYSFTVTPADHSFCARISPKDQPGFSGPALNQTEWCQNDPVCSTWKSYENQYPLIDAGREDRAIDTGYDFKYTPTSTTPTPTPIPGTPTVVLKGSLTSTGWVTPWTGTASIVAPTFDMQATVTGGSGSIVYKFYCLESSATPFHTSVSTTINPYATANSPCAYTSPGSYNAKVVVKRGTLPEVTDLLPITLTAVPIPPGFLAGRIVKDDNANGRYDAGEKFVRDPSGPACSPEHVKDGIIVEYSGLTTSGSTLANKCVPPEPRYRVSVPPGTYDLKLTLPTNWEATSSDTATVGVTSDRDTVQWFYARPVTFGVEFTATPDTGIETLKPVLKADVTGTATSTINYSMWWKCSNTSVSVAETNAACGTLLTPAAGACRETPGIGYKCDGVLTDPLSVSLYTYTVGTHTPKVIVERGRFTPIQRRVTVTVTANRAPTASVTLAPLDFYCGRELAGFKVNWTYSDLDSHPQSAYQVQVSRESDFTPLVYDSLKVTSANKYHSIFDRAWDVPFYVRVRVWDSLDKPSAFASAPLPFLTPKHRYPTPNFDWTPIKPVIDKDITFTDTSTYYGGSTWASSLWTWPTCTGTTCAKSSSTDHNPINRFFSTDTYRTDMTVTDSDGYSCSLNRTPRIGTPVIPGWREVAPQ